MRVTGPWNKLSKSEYDKTYYATNTSKSTYLEWSRRGHADSDDYSYGFMRNAKSKYTTLTEALKSGIAIAKTWGTAYIFKGEDQIGEISLPDKKMSYTAIYTSGNKKTFLNSDGTVFQGDAKPRKTIKAHIKFMSWSYGTHDGGIIEANNMNDLRRKICREYNGIHPLSKVVIYIDNKEFACVIASNSERWTWWPIGETAQKFNPDTGHIIKR